MPNYLIMPGETQTLKWIPLKPGMYPMYCTDFCSALHQEMQGYVRVSPAGSSTPLTFMVWAKQTIRLILLERNK
jgi:nitrous-oxide reductase